MVTKTRFRPTPKYNGIKYLESKTTCLAPTSQKELFHVEKQIEIDGVEMGVLANGLPYLTESGLARMCGIDRKVLNRLAASWDTEQLKPRGKQINQLLQQAAYSNQGLYLRSELNGVEINAYTEQVCLAVLEYYAFIADEKRERAITAFRTLARLQFREFVYKAVGYTPDNQLSAGWQQFHDRVSLVYGAVPNGYFSIFKEIGDMIIRLGHAKMHIDHEFVPDISVGIHWGKHWVASGFDLKYGMRIKYEHYYPNYFPQAISNPQEPWCYPDAALAEFRRWVRENYMGQGKFDAYISTKVHDKAQLLQVRDSVKIAYLQ